MWSVCGSNFQLGNKRGEASYYFSIHGDSWGWASWRRAWKHYPEAEQSWFSFRDTDRLNDVFLIPQEREYWREILDLLFIESQPSSWAYQWWLSSWMNNGLHAWPNPCLVSNRGFDGEGTHTFGDNDFASPPLESLQHLLHPEFVLPCREADEFAYLYRRDGYRLVESEKYGRIYPWILRGRQLKKEGLISYIALRLLRRRMPSN